MKAPHWADLVSRIVPQEVDDLDELTRAYDPRPGGRGREVFPSINPVLRQNAFVRPDTVCVGARIPAPVPAGHDRALRLASLSAEEDLEVILLALTDLTGLEHFGFRIERIPKARQGHREPFEEQVLRFWSIDLVI